MALRRRKRRTYPERGDSAYAQLWRIVDGAVEKAFRAHPEYLPDLSRERVIRNSINKRVVGDLLGCATTVEQNRSGLEPGG